MQLRKILCLVVALMMALGALALAESDDLQAQLDAANARIAELEAEVAKYLPYYESGIVAEFGEDGIIRLEDARQQYEEVASMYAQYGIPVDTYAADIKQSIVEGMVQDAVLDAKAEELGLSQLDEATMADLEAMAADDLETYVTYYTDYFATEGATDEENREATIQGLAEHGITQEQMLQDRVENYVSEQLTDYVTKDVTVTDEEVQETYQDMIESDKDYEEDDQSYTSARASGETIAWNPEGYRAVKHVLIKFSDEQAQQYSELQDTLETLQDELAALDEPADEEAEAEADEAEADEEVEEPRTREEIQTDIGAVGASIEALYSELMPKAQEVVDAFNNGTDIDTLIAEYGEDPGMQNEPTASEGYAVAERSTSWDPAFTEGAMSIAEVGQISEPVRGKNGVHIIYYLSDITPGEVPYEDIREGVAAAALEDKVTQTFDDQVAVWVEEAKPVYHLDRF